MKKKTNSATISASMIVKNEEVMLLDCLNSIKTVDEIVIVDTGSEDNTVKIIKEFGKTFKGELILKHFKWIDDFAAARNEALKYNTKDWILIIDADETIEKGGVEKIRRRLVHVESNALKLKVKTDIEELISPRVFKNGEGILWKGAIHNVLSITTGDITNIQIRSKTSPAHELDPDRTVRILSKELQKNPNNTRYQYYMARERLKFNQIDAAIYWLERRTSGYDWSNEQADAFYLLGTCYSMLGRRIEAVESWIKAILIHPEFGAPYESLSKAFAGGTGAKWAELGKLAKNTNLLFKR